MVKQEFVRSCVNTYLIPIYTHLLSTKLIRLDYRGATPSRIPFTTEKKKETNSSLLHTSYSKTITTPHLLEVSKTTPSIVIDLYKDHIMNHAQQKEEITSNHPTSPQHHPQVINNSQASLTTTIPLLQNQLNEFQATLDKKFQPTKLSYAYNVAMTMSPAYVQNEKLRLLFLRSTAFNFEKAALHFITFLEEKKRLFGSDKIVQMYINTTDLSDIEMDELKSGWMQFLPFRDTSGRAVLWMSNNYLSASSEKDFRMTATRDILLRQIWYQVMSGIEDEVTQEHGIVLVLDLVAESNKKKGDSEKTSTTSTKTSMIYWAIARAFELLPILLLRIYFCVHGANGSATGIISQFTNGLSKISAKSEITIHHGSHEECQNFLATTCGIPIKQYPVLYDGSIKAKYHQQWLGRREVLEENRLKQQQLLSKQQQSLANERGGGGESVAASTTTTTSSTNPSTVSTASTSSTTATPAPPTIISSDLNDLIELPARFDILLGKGVPFQTHPGNVRLRQLIDTYKDQYSSSSPSEKRRLLEYIMVKIQDNVEPVRFLERNEAGWWVKISSLDQVMKKISNRFRRSGGGGGRKKSAAAVASSLVLKQQQQQQQQQHTNSMNSAELQELGDFDRNGLEEPTSTNTGEEKSHHKDGPNIASMTVATMISSATNNNAANRTIMPIAVVAASTICTTAPSSSVRTDDGGTCSTISAPATTTILEAAAAAANSTIESTINSPEEDFHETFSQEQQVEETAGLGGDNSTARPGELLRNNDHYDYYDIDNDIDTADFLDEFMED